MNFNTENILNSEIILNSFIKFVQKKGKYTKAKKVIISINEKLNSNFLLNINFLSILEHIIYKLLLPIIMINNKIHQSKYYFIVISVFKYIKKFIFSPFLKAINIRKKLPFIYNFIIELSNVIQENGSLIEYRQNVVNIFTETNSYIRSVKHKNLNKCNIFNNFMYINKKLKYINRYKYNNKRPFYIKTYIPFKKNINDECTKPSSKLKFKNCKLIN